MTLPVQVGSDITGCTGVSVVVPRPTETRRLFEDDIFESTFVQSSSHLNAREAGSNNDGTVVFSTCLGI